MRVECDFATARRAPYAGLLTKTVTLNLDEASFGYFTSMATALDVPVRMWVSLYLRDCARSERKLSSKASRERPAD